MARARISSGAGSSASRLSAAISRAGSTAHTSMSGRVRTKTKGGGLGEHDVVVDQRMKLRLVEVKAAP